MDQIVQNLKSSHNISESCTFLVHIRAETEDRPLSTVFLLNLVILEHHPLNFIDFRKVPL